MCDCQEALVDAAIAEGRIAYSERETTVWALGVAPELVVDQLANRPPDVIQAGRNYAEQTDDYAYTAHFEAMFGATPGLG